MFASVPRSPHPPPYQNFHFVPGDTAGVGVYDTDDAFIERLLARAAAASGKPRLVPLAVDLNGLIVALAPLLPADTIAVSSYSHQRINGRVDADGAGYIVESFPYGGSVIDGYNERLTAVLTSGAVLVVEAPDLRQPVAHVYDDSPDVRTIIASVGGHFDGS